ncbi:MAG TPA: hypothetical protein VNK04_22425 [Gemmataceae bacterium]|jgi:glucose dehydrogenase|nr:hypothetical protein [Gemmataceae bacterium]
MKILRRSVLIVLGLALLLPGLGCGGPQPNSLEDEANAKLAAINRLADAMARDPNGAEARAALEEFQVTTIDPKKNPKQAEEIVTVYRQRIHGKYRGEVAQQVQGLVAGIENSLKEGK